MRTLNPVTVLDEKFTRESQWQRWLSRLPKPVSHFLGWRDADTNEPTPPVPLFKKIPNEIERVLFAWIGTFVGIALLIAVFSYSGDLVGLSPIVVPSLGASCVLVFGTFESPFAQPRNLVFGHFLSALVGVIFQRLFALNGDGFRPATSSYGGAMEVGQLTWFAASLATATATVVMQVTGTIHPPAGATALIATTTPTIVTASWRYLYVMLVSSLLMLGWAMLWNNLGSRRYPIYWISPDKKGG